MRAAYLVWTMALTVALASALALGQDAFADMPLRSDSESATIEPAAASSGPSLARVVGSLGAVAVLIVALGWVYRRFATGAGPAGGAAVSLVSRTMLTPKHQVMVLRVGHRLLVVGDAGHGMNSLCEITDPAEVTAVLSAVNGGAELQALKGAAFAASLDAADSDFDPLDDEPHDDEPHDDEPHEDEPLDSLHAADDDVRALIERVRGMAGNGRATAEPATR